MKKILILFMVLAMALPMLVACNNTTGTTSTPSQGGAVSTDDTSLPGDTSEGNDDIAPEIRDLGGRVINILCWDWSAGSASILGYTGEVISNAEGDPSRVDVAKKAVVDAVEDEYKVTIEGLVTNKTSFLDDVKNMVTVGT